jgi:hypothetical protein
LPASFTSDRRGRCRPWSSFLARHRTAGAARQSEAGPRPEVDEGICVVYDVVDVVARFTVVVVVLVPGALVVVAGDDVVDDDVEDDDVDVAAGVLVVGAVVVGCAVVVDPGVVVGAGALTGLTGCVVVVGRGRVANLVVLVEDEDVEEVDDGEGGDVVVTGAARGSASRAASIDVKVVLAGSERRQRTNGFIVDDVDAGTFAVALGFGAPLPVSPTSSMTTPMVTNARAPVTTLRTGKVRVCTDSPATSASPAWRRASCAGGG